MQNIEWSNGVMRLMATRVFEGTWTAELEWGTAWRSAYGEALREDRRAYSHDDAIRALANDVCALVVRLYLECLHRGRGVVSRRMRRKSNGR